MNSGRVNRLYARIKQLKHENETLTRKLMAAQNDLNKADDKIEELEDAIDEIQERWSGKSGLRKILTRRQY